MEPRETGDVHEEAGGRVSKIARRFAPLASIVAVVAGVVGIAKNFEWGPFAPPDPPAPAFHGDVFEQFGTQARALGAFMRAHRGQVVDLDVRLSTSPDMGGRWALSDPSSGPQTFTVWERCGNPKYEHLLPGSSTPAVPHCFGTSYFPSDGFRRNGVVALMSGRYRLGELVSDQQIGSVQVLPLCAEQNGQVPATCD